jgi:hypothetical protein
MSLTLDHCIRDRLIWHQDNVIMPIRGEVENLDDDEEVPDADGPVSYVLHPNCAIEEM